MNPVFAPDFCIAPWVQDFLKSSSYVEIVQPSLTRFRKKSSGCVHQTVKPLIPPKNKQYFASDELNPGLTALPMYVAGKYPRFPSSRFDLVFFFSLVIPVVLPSPADSVSLQPTLRLDRYNQLESYYRCNRLNGTVLFLLFDIPKKLAPTIHCLIQECTEPQLWKLRAPTDSRGTER